jgi:hypothetical protein
VLAPWSFLGIVTTDAIFAADPLSLLLRRPFGLSFQLSSVIA